MSYRACEYCGCRMYGGFCTNCEEEHFIADQYRELGEGVPESIARAEREQIQQRDLGLPRSTIHVRETD